VKKPDYRTWPFFYRAANADEEWLFDNRRFVRGRIIDVGTPRGIRPFLSECGSVEVLDIQPTVSKFEFSSLTDIQADVTDLRGALEDASVDTLIATNILEHVERPQAAMDEFHRVLRPGGHLFLLTPLCYPWHMNPDYWRFTEQGIRLLAHRAGFRAADIIELSTTRPAREMLVAHFAALWENKRDAEGIRLGLSVRYLLRRGD